MIRVYQIVVLILLSACLVRLNQVYNEIKPKELTPITYESCIDGGLPKENCIIVEELDDEKLR